MEKSLSRAEGPLTLEQHLSEKLLKQRERQAIAEDHRLARARDSEKQRAIDDLTRAAYTAAMIEHGQESLRGRLQNVTSHEERNLEVLTYMMNEQKALDNLIENSSKNTLAQTKREKARRFGRKAMNATGAWLSKGNKWQQLAKGVVVGAGASLLAGAIGGAVAAGGIGAAAAAGGTAAVRYGKSYAKGRARGITREASKPELHAKTMNEHHYDTVHQSFARAQELMYIERESLVGKHQDRNMQAHKSAAKAVAIGAIAGGVIGSMLHFEMDYAHADELVTPPFADGDGTPGIVMPNLAPRDLLEPMLIDDTLAQPNLFDADTIEGFGIDDEIFLPGLGNGVEGVDAYAIESDGILEPHLTEPDTLPGLPVEDGLAQPGLPETDDLYNPTVHESGDTLPAQTIDASGTNSELPADSVEQAPTVIAGVNPELDLAKETFTVESGHGYGRELIEAAKANGIDLSSQEAWAAHQAIVDGVGGDYIDLTEYAGVDTYSMGASQYEIGISAPGEATWSLEAQPIIADLVDDGSINGSIDIAVIDTVQGSGTDIFGVSEEFVTINPEPELPVVGSGEGIESFVSDEYSHDLTPDQSNELGEQLQKVGYAYKSDQLAEVWGNSYGVNHPGQVDTGFNAIVNDMVGKSIAGDEVGLDTDYTISSEDWSQIETMLGDAASQDTLGELSTQGVSLMQDLGPMLEGVVYPDGSDIVSADAQGNWILHDSDSPLPQKAYDTIYRYLNANHTAFEKVQDLVKVL